MCQYYNAFPYDVYLLYRFADGEQELYQHLRNTSRLFGGFGYNDQFWEFEFHSINDHSSDILTPLGFHSIAMNEMGKHRIYADSFGCLSFGKGALFTILNEKHVGDPNSLIRIYIIKKNLMEFLATFKHFFYNEQKNLLQYYDTVIHPHSDITSPHGIRVRLSIVYNPWDTSSEGDKAYSFQLRISTTNAIQGRYRVIKTHVIISDQNHQREIEWEGMNNSYPEFYLGCEDYIWDDCIYTPALRGRMKGKIHLFDVERRHAFIAIIGDAELAPPKGTGLLDVNLETFDIKVLFKN
jgi:uncharacterized protein affecting Mg2+/Co2+ transport